MSYKTYITEAIVCGSSDSYTSDRGFLLFTRTAGMLWASARSVRMEKSKQRYALQPFSHIRVSLVKGKQGWRIGSVECLENMYSSAETRSARGNVIRIIKLLRQYVHGEEAHVQIFDDTVAACQQLTLPFVTETEKLVDRYVLRLLYQLGYIPEKKSYTSILSATDWYTNNDEISPEVYHAVERAEQVSHL